MTANEAHFDYALRLGDDALILSQRLGEWCGHAPALETDLSLANIALDLIGQATLFLSYAAELEDMIPLVNEAGGVAVIAHPWGRQGGTVLDEEAFASLKEIGLAGIEVDHQDHSAELRVRLRGIAAELDLVVTGSSDHHGLGKVDHDLGVNTTDPEQYERLVSLAAPRP